MEKELKYGLQFYQVLILLMLTLFHDIKAQCPVADLPSDMEADSSATGIAGGDKVNVTCKYDNRAFHPVDTNIGITGNDTHNYWTIECNNSTNNFTWASHPTLPICKCIVISALEQHSNEIQTKNFTSEPVEGSDPVAVGEKITLKCKEDDAEVGDSMSNQFPMLCNSNGDFIPDSLPQCEVPKVCENASIPLNDSGLSAPSANSVKAFRSVDYFCTNSSLVMDTHGKKYSIVCNSDGTFATPDWPTCREAANCTGDIPAPPASSKLENSTSNLADLLEFDEAIFKCSDSSHVVGESSENEFKLKCDKDLGNSVIGFETPDPWPICKEPPVTTTVDPNAPTTPKPLPPCQCIGDIPISQAKNVLDKFCRNYTLEGNMLVNPVGDEGTTPPSRRRCGSRAPDAPSLADHCYCSGVDKQANLSFWMTFTMKTEPWQWTLDPSSKAEKSDLLRPQTENYRLMKAQIEKAIDDAIFDDATLNKGYAGATLFRFVKGEEVPMRWPPHFPKERPKPTTTTVSTTTVNSTSSATSGNDTSNATSNNNSNTDTSDNSTDTSGTGRRKRQLSTSSTPYYKASTGYNYINVDINLKYKKAWTDLDSTWNAVETFFNNTLQSGKLGLEPNHLPIAKDCNRTHTCRVKEFDENPTCEWNMIMTISDLYDVNARLPFERPFNATNRPMLEAGDIVELRCAEATPKRLPNVDQEDDDPTDGIIRMFCMAPLYDGDYGSFSLSTPVPACTVICEDPLPIAHNDSKMTLKEVIPLKPNWAKDYNKKVDAQETFNEQKHLFSGDRLVYHCDNEIDGVYGGIDETFESYKCTDDGLYDIPNPTKKQLARGEHGWPLCKSQEGLVIRAVEAMLDRYDRKISDRYKMIDYQEQDNQKEIIVLSNYFLNTTVPTILGLSFLIFLCCCCTRKGSPICNLCRGDS